MTISEIELQINVSEPDISADQLDRLTVALMRQLRDLGAESVERAIGGPPPVGAKGVATTTGALNVTAAPNFVERMLSFLQMWTSRGNQRIVKIKTPSGTEIEFTPDQPLSPEQLAAYVQAVTTGPSSAAASPAQQRLDHRCRTQLWETLTSYFDESELRTLCFHLNINYQDLSGNNRTDKIIAFVEYVERHRRIEKLLEVGPKLRKEIPWDEICTTTGA